MLNQNFIHHSLPVAQIGNLQQDPHSCHKRNTLELLNPVQNPNCTAIVALDLF